jgi:hypothetical protein
MALGQSWTDPFSNHTHLTNVDVTAHLEELVGVGTTPRHLLLPLLHEAAHHWCFLSPVGNTVALLNMRVRRRALQVVDDQEAPKTPLLLDLVSSRVVTELLRPLAEGIALAMEFDAVSRKTNFVSYPFVAAVRAFAPGSAEVDIVLFSAHLNEALTAARIAPQGVDRRLNVYADRMDEGGTGYLLGYLATRSMMYSLWRVLGRLVEEGDLCVGYMRAYFYQDWELVDLLLDRTRDEIEHANAIRQHIAERTWGIRDVTASQIEAFEDLASTDADMRDPRYVRALGLDPDRARRGQDRLETLGLELSQALDVSTKHEDLADFLFVLESETAAARRTVFLGSADVVVSVKGGFADVSTRDRVLLSDLTTGASDAVGPGELEIFFESEHSDRPRLLHVTNSQGLVAFVSAQHDANDPDPDDAPALPRSALRQIGAVFDEIVEHAVSTSWVSIGLAHFMEATPSVCQGIYRDVALRYVPTDQMDDVAAVLGAGGIRALLGNNRDLAEALAIAGAVIPTRPLRPLLDAEIRRWGLEHDLVDELAKVGERGFSVLDAKDDWLLGRA